LTGHWRSHSISPEERAARKRSAIPMLFRRLRKSLAVSSGRCLVVLLTLIGYATTSCGLPIPACASIDHSQPFPCQNHRCGCTSAEQCWRQCCCFTLEEKMAWAKANGVEPPAHLCEAGWHAPRQRDQKSGSGCAGCCPGPSDSDTSPSAPTTFLFGLSARRCAGLGTVWTGSLPAPVPLPPVTWQYDWVVVAWLCVCMEFPRPLLMAPPTPPPRS